MGSSLPGSARIGRLRLAVSNLERSVRFYTQVIGLAVLQRESSVACLGSQGGQRVLLELEEQPGVQPVAPHSRLGLYHSAFLLPTREDLSSFVRHLVRHNIPFGSADHFVSEALYLTDPDGLTVEVYADRDRSAWQYNGRDLNVGTAPLLFESLPRVPEGNWQGAPPATTVGHVHFYIGDLQAAESFYVRGLGMEQATRGIPGALFVAAGGYHHHIGLNTWAAGAPPASPSDARILFWQLILPDAATVAHHSAQLAAEGYSRLSGSTEAPIHVDPWGIRLVLSAPEPFVSSTAPLA